jgi:hypothetical protein
MIQDRLIEETAQALAGESFVIPTFQSVSLDIASTDISPTNTSLKGEAGSRLPVTRARINNLVSYSSFRSATTDLVSTLGDTIEGFGSFATSTGNTLLTHVALETPFTQTVNFDVELITTLEIKREE